MKTCSRCGASKPRTDFYADRRAPDGLKAQCKTCHGEGNVRTRDPLKHRVSRRESMRRARERDPEKFRERERRAPVREVAKVLVRRALHAALRSGAIVRPPTCSRCSHARRLTAHHPDYAKPLDVMWLCYGCHAEIEHPLAERRVTP